MSEQMRVPLGGLALAAVFGLVGLAIGGGESELGGLLLLAAFAAAVVSLVRLGVALLRPSD